MPRTSKEEFIKKSKKTFGEEKFDYSLVVYEHGTIPVILKCNRHGEIKVTPERHLHSTYGCPDCGKEERKANSGSRITTEEFIENANKVHENKFDYSLVKYVNTETPVDIICPDHGTTSQTPHMHLTSDYGCSGCGKDARRTARMTTEEFIKKAQETHGTEKYDYSLVEYKGTNYKVTIKCNIHNFIFEQRAIDHTDGQGCRKCRTDKLVLANTLTQEEFIEKANKQHEYKFDYSLVKYIGTDIPVDIKCPDHGIFSQKPHYHLTASHACPECTKDAIRIRQTFTTEDFIKKAQDAHGTEKYDYSLAEYKGADEKIIIICKIHNHQFEQRAISHTNKGNGGCKKCMIETVSLVNKFTQEEFIERAQTIHELEEYDYSLVEYDGLKSKIIIICKTHGKFEQRASDHISGNGCQACGLIKQGLKTKYTKEEFIQRANEIHDNYYDYSLVDYQGVHTKVIIKCLVHGEFEQLPASHINSRHGCTKCATLMNADRKRIPKEKFIEASIKIHGKQYDYTTVLYKQLKDKVKIKCSTHGFFEQSAARHMTGSKCPKCLLCPSCQLWRTYGEPCDYCGTIQPGKANAYTKTKEYKVVNFLKANLPDNDFIHNKSIGTDCTNGHLFPDIRFDCLFYNLIVEIDEFQHRGSGYDCDKKRMYDITAKLGQPCIFIRYNPDNKDSNQDTLLKLVKQYLQLDENSKKPWDDTLCFAVFYLFYAPK
jgi:hypothetical protein